MEKEKNEQIRFEFSGWHDEKVTAFGIPELEGKRGLNIGEKMAMFWDDEYEMYIVNTETGKMRQFSDSEGRVLVSPEDIDMNSIKRHCPGGAESAEYRIQKYGRMNRYDDFKKSLAAIEWVLCPDGQYFADDDGFGCENNDEESVYCVINRDLEIIRPFAVVPNVDAYLRKIAKKI